jgi:hypothetical protein
VEELHTFTVYCTCIFFFVQWRTAATRVFGLRPIAQAEAADPWRADSRSGSSAPSYVSTRGLFLLSQVAYFVLKCFRSQWTCKFVRKDVKRIALSWVTKHMKFHQFSFSFFSKLSPPLVPVTSILWFNLFIFSLDYIFIWICLDLQDMGSLGRARQGSRNDGPHHDSLRRGSAPRRQRKHPRSWSQIICTSS